MPKTFNKVIYKPDIHSSDTYQVIVADSAGYKKWKDGDKTIPLADVVDSFQVFHSDQGTQGILGHPSKQQLDNDFGTHKDVDVVQIILEKGDLQHATNKEGYSTTNDSNQGVNVVSSGSYRAGTGGR